MEETTSNTVKHDVAISCSGRGYDRFEPRLIDATVEIKNEDRNVLGKVIMDFQKS
jgi:hypothetical protein